MIQLSFLGFSSPESGFNRVLQGVYMSHSITKILQYPGQLQEYCVHVNLFTVISTVYVRRFFLRVKVAGSKTPDDMASLCNY